MDDRKYSYAPESLEEEYAFLADMLRHSKDIWNRCTGHLLTWRW